MISPLRLNIALHGIDDALGVRRRASDGQLHPSSRAVVRYADDLVVFCGGREEAERTIQDLSGWLAERGLSLSSEKTRIVHIRQGFDFLGFNVRQYEDPTARAGAKLLIRPSKASMKRIRARLRQEWRALSGAPATAVVARLAPIINGWANYFRTGVSSEAFSSLDHYVTWRALRYAKRKHPGKSAQWRYEKYFGRRNPRRQDRWVFGDETTGKYLPKFSWTRIRRHVLVRGAASPDDPALAAYWRWRRQEVATQQLEPKLHRLAMQQGFVCPVCGDALANGEVLERHHVILDRANPERDLPSNLRLVHLYCHDQIHSGRGPSVTEQLIREA